ncbi:MAG: 50S ribosomal protein L35 [Patescibacteria group bacterium]|nr:50S ribosomal protein L35 [Patescibacteria group bacterium]MDD5715684.1 50S ribosomal protein L35 [Patescibacteria group bacterium]
MPKLKTHQATTKRFHFSGKGKIMRRKAGQDHFNSRESGEDTKRKRRDTQAHRTEHKAIKTVTPYH